MIGYYCAPRGKPLSQPEAEKGLKAIGIKGVAEPEATYSTARIELKQPPSDQIVDDDSDPCAAKKRMVTSMPWAATSGIIRKSLAKCYANHQRYSEAVDEYKKTLGLWKHMLPSYLATQYNEYAKLLDKAGRLQEAKEACAHARRLKSSE